MSRFIFEVWWYFKLFFKQFSLMSTMQIKLSTTLRIIIIQLKVHTAQQRL